MFFKSRKRNEIRTVPLVENKAERTNLHLEFEQSVAELKAIFQKDTDFICRTFLAFDRYPAVIMYLSSLVDKELINKDILRPLMREEWEDKDSLDTIKKTLLEGRIYFAECEEVVELEKVHNGMLKGKAVVLIDGIQEAFLYSVGKIEKRGVDQPQGEQVIRGPRDGFIESLQTNIGLVRARLPIPNLRIKELQIGRMTKSTVVLCYVEGTANEALVSEVENRLNKIDIDRILDSGYIEQFIQDNPRSPFPQIQSTERPDKAVGNLVEGRVVIMVDGTPLALICPATFNQLYHTSEDYNERAMMTSIIRMVRFVALNFSLYFPSLYVAVLSFHPELIPAQFAVAVTSGRSGVPFPVFLEVFLMEVAMEILREATVRMPQQVGGALSIVGVLVIGQAAVEAGFVSPITVVIIALSTIGSFATPAYNTAIAFRMLRFPLLIGAGSLGLLGLAAGAMFIINHMLSLRSFGVPYLSPVVPLDWQGMKDSIIRAPLWWLRKRPEELHSPNTVRVDSGVAPEPTNPLESTERKGGKADGE